MDNIQKATADDDNTYEEKDYTNKKKVSSFVCFLFFPRKKNPLSFPKNRRKRKECVQIVSLKGFLCFQTIVTAFLLT